MTLKESIKKAKSKRFFEDASGSMKGARNVQGGNKPSKNPKSDIEGTISSAIENDELDKMTVVAINSGTDIFNKIAKGPNGVETLAESLKRVSAKRK